MRQWFPETHAAVPYVHENDPEVVFRQTLFVYEVNEGVCACAFVVADSRSLVSALTLHVVLNAFPAQHNRFVYAVPEVSSICALVLAASFITVISLPQEELT